jgi:hypothetical protein
MRSWAWLIFLAAAALEVGGDALVRQGLRGNRWILIVAGCIALSGYGLVVNLVMWDFSRLLGLCRGIRPSECVDRASCIQGGNPAVNVDGPHIYCRGRLDHSIRQEVDVTFA